MASVGPGAQARRPSGTALGIRGSLNVVMVIVITPNVFYLFAAYNAL